VAEFRPVSPVVKGIHEGLSQQPVSTPPIAFMRPNKFSSTTSLTVQRMPVFDAAAHEQARRSAQSGVAAAVETRVYAQTTSEAEQKLAAQLQELIAKKCEEFSRTLDRRLDVFYQQTASRLDVLSGDIVRHSCQVLNQQVSEALNSTAEDCARHNRALVDAECHAALDRFAARVEKIAALNLESNRREMQNISAALKIRLRGVAHALEELGPSHHRS
jgi:hypothetical protein